MSNKILILTREDLFIYNKNKHIDELSFFDFENIREIERADLALFIDKDDTNRKKIKCRFDVLSYDIDEIDNAITKIHKIIHNN